MSDYSEYLMNTSNYVLTLIVLTTINGCINPCLQGLMHPLITVWNSAFVFYAEKFCDENEMAC